MAPRIRLQLSSAITGAAVALCMSARSGSSEDVSLQGAGATFPAPLYRRWFPSLS
jgi:ABC-type phosphate transport system substrate-binding protein